MRECVKLKDTYARDIGAEWVCLLAIREVGIDRLFRRESWSDIQINTMLVHLITCTIDPPSELKSMRIMGENSAVCKLICGNQEWRPAFF